MSLLWVCPHAKLDKGQTGVYAWLCVCVCALEYWKCILIFIHVTSENNGAHKHTHTHSMLLSASPHCSSSTIPRNCPHLPTPPNYTHTLLIHVSCVFKWAQHVSHVSTCVYILFWLSAVGQWWDAVNVAWLAVWLHSWWPHTDQHTQGIYVCFSLNLCLLLVFLLTECTISSFLIFLCWALCLINQHFIHKRATEMLIVRHFTL